MTSTVWTNERKSKKKDTELKTKQKPLCSAKKHEVHEEKSVRDERDL